MFKRRITDRLLMCFIITGGEELKRSTQKTANQKKKEALILPRKTKICVRN